MGNYTEDGKRYQLTDPLVAPKAGAFLWNQQMMLQMTCRGYATAQFMQPEPAKYAHGPSLAAKTFMQPEHPYFAHHPGRFFYLNDHAENSLWSAPYEPVRAAHDSFSFEPGLSDLRWHLEKDNIRIELTVTLASDAPLERWSVKVTNVGDIAKPLTLTPYFPVGYSSWMNMSADFHPALNAVVARCISPYQKLEDYALQKNFKDLTFLMASEPANSWATRLQNFEGEGGLHNPDALMNSHLDMRPALYESPACIMQYKFNLEPGSSKSLQFLFGPAQSDQEVAELRTRYLATDTIEQDVEKYAQYIHKSLHHFTVKSPDTEFNHFVNYWLPRQLHYHGDSQRLCTDPQTRNYLQDAMGMAYLDANKTKTAILTALSQQKKSGQMPDGILLSEGAELKYINKIPHTDHGVWVVICLQAYLNETGDLDFLSQPIAFADDHKTDTVFNHICLSIDWLLADRDHRGLSFIAQGDWCDPMNMVGPKGIGVSGWLTQALAYALMLWLPICEKIDQQRANHYQHDYDQLKKIINDKLWDGAWYLRGYTDNNRAFGSAQDTEGRIFLNTQSWALLADVANAERKSSLLNAVAENLDTPYGPMMNAPAFTHMHEDIGRVTQKFPGSAENGSVYNHAAMFWCAALFAIDEGDRAFAVMQTMLPFERNEGLSRRGQLPVYIPNYYRGAFYQYPEKAGLSSHLFNTGTVAWYYRLLIEELAGLKGTLNGISIRPKLPSHWPELFVTRRFRQCTISLTVCRDANLVSDELWCDNQRLTKFEIDLLPSNATLTLVYKIGAQKND